VELPPPVPEGPPESGILSEGSDSISLRHRPRGRDASSPNGYRTPWSVMSDDLAPCRIGRPLHDLAELPPLVPEVFVSSPFPRAFPSAFILPRASIRLQSFTSQSLPPVVSDWAVPSMRFRASSRHQRPGFAVTMGSSHRRRPPSGFCNLSAVCSPKRLAGLFHPAGTSRLPLQGVSPSRSRCGSSPPPCPLAVTATGAPLARRPTRGPTSGPCSPGGSVATGPRLSEPSARSPPGLHPLQGLLHPDP